MKKCPHCGMNIRDNVEVCGYCGGEIREAPSRGPGGKGGTAPQRSASQRQAQTRAPPAPPAEPEGGDEGDEEEEGGLSKVLQPGEQVLIGSLNVSVKKFFFHAYLTNKRIFLIDTQEKKIKVTAKDVPRETIDDCVIEFTENSDPVLVLSIRSAEDEVKTMKIVFAQDGADRSGEIEDWVNLIKRKEPEAKKPQKTAPAQREPEPEPAEEEYQEEEQPVEPLPKRKPAAPARREELTPSKKPVKEHERQPPVKRLIPMTREPEPEPEPEVEVQPVRRVQVRTFEETQVRKVPVTRDLPPAVRSDTQIVRKPEVHAAVKTAMKNPVQPVRHVGVPPVKSQTEPVRRPVPVREPAEEVVPVEIPVVQRRVVAEERVVADEPAESPQFCHNCGKRLPSAANFCPGCGTRLGSGRTIPSKHMTNTVPRPVPAQAPVPAHARKIPKIEEVVDEDEDDAPAPVKRPPVKKAPKGSDMTILQKFLRR